MRKQYEIRHDKVRERRGLKSWGLFEFVEPGFSRGIAAYHTEAEALAAKAEKETQS